MKKQGFTLAETLLTLAIIGICAAMLITTIKNISPNEQSYLVMARKAVGNFTQATKQVVLFNSTSRTMDKLTLDGNACNSDACVTNLYGKYLQITEISTSNPTNLGEGNCSNVAQLVDGLMFCVDYSADCSLGGDATVQILPPADGVVSAVIASDACAMIYYDVNGAKTPNIVGKDRFVIPVKRNGVKVQAIIKTETTD